MDDRTILGHLEALAHTLGIEVRYESMEGEVLFSSGGMCRIKDKQVIIVNEKATIADKVNTLIKALSRLDLSQIYLKPGIRDLLEGDV